MSAEPIKKKDTTAKKQPYKKPLFKKFKLVKKIGASTIFI